MSSASLNLQDLGAFSVSQVHIVAQQCLDCTCREGPMFWSPLGRRSALQVGSGGASHCLEGTGAKQQANTSPGSVAPRDAAFLGIKCTLRLKLEKLCNFLALCVSLFSLQHLCLLLLSEPGALHKGNSSNFFPSHTDLFFLSASKGLF